jgi:cytochrome c553
MHAVARWLRPPVLGLAAAAFVAAAAAAQSFTPAERLQMCGACHGEDGNSKMENIPSLAGQPDFFILNQLFLMREGVRKIEAMAPVVQGMKDDEMVSLSNHFAKLAPKPSGEAINPDLVKRGTEIAAGKRCDSCHGRTLAGDQQIPRIAKQRIDYLIHAMKGFRDGTRPGADTAMSASVAGLSDADLTALAHYAAAK